jgi:lipid-binding SYLF domain-containing protein
MLIIMTGKGLQAILDDQVQIGGEISGAVGPYGAGAEATTTSNLDADVIAYSIAKGAFIGVNIEGTALIPRDSLIREYYGTSVSPQSVVLDGSVGNPHADGLRATLQRLVSQ